MDLLVVLVLVIGFGTVIFLLTKEKKSPPELLEVIKILQKGSSESNRVLMDVQRNLGEIGEIGRSMRDLQEFLRSPKLRGNIGEHILNELLREMLPKESFHIQYTFKSGEKVDAAIKSGSGIIPIDSKFPMENFRRMMKNPASPESVRGAKDFQRDVKGHIDEISRKYIIPEEGTIDYALMYIPSEAVYYEVVNSHDLFDYASKKRVLPVSPTTFYAYIKAILMSFEGQKIEEKAKQVLVALRAIQKDYEKVEENMGILQKHFTNAYNMLNNLTSSVRELGQKISHTKKLDT
jgi:DNA recombination protein RmuC